MSAAILALASLLGAPTPATSPGDPKLQELVHQLGSKSYRQREDAARQLLQQGATAVAVLNEGTKDSDPEVSERCRQLLPMAAAKERDEKLAAFLKDPTAAPPKGLAGAERFLKITGDDKAARAMYAEMLSLHHAILEAAETDATKAGELYRQFCDEAYSRWYAGTRTGRYSYDNIFASNADVVFFLFMSGDTRVRKNDGNANRSSIFFNGTQITKAISDGKDGSPAVRKIFLDWLENEPQSYLQQRGFQLAANANLKEALPVALKLLDKKDPNNNNYGKAQIMISLAKLGTKEHIPLLEKYLEDKTNIGTVNFGNGLPMSVQIRDVAMGISVLLAGQKLNDFGFDTRFGGGTPTSYYYFGFPEEPGAKENKLREDAHVKWKEWAKKNLEAKKK
jgi:hypothetical protein